MTVRNSEWAGEHLRVTREGKWHHEFCLERGFLRILRPSGETVFHPVLARPRPLGHGKSAWSFCAVYCEFLPIAQVVGFDWRCDSIHLR